MFRVGFFYGAVASGSGNNVQLKDARFVELPYTFSSEAAAQAAAAALASTHSGLFVDVKIWQFA